jgi:biopolymer transport protein TolR
MAMGGAGGGGGSRRRGRSRRGFGALTEINVTPLVDVMLVLLIIFMISAPLLTSGVEVNLPDTEAPAVEDQNEPLTVTIRKDGAIFLQETPTPYEALAPRLTAIAGAAKSRPIFVRADGAAAYEIVARVMAKLSTSGFTKINLITDTASPAEATAQAPTAVEGHGQP